MDSGLAWPVGSKISSGSKSSRGAWMTVLRPLEFVNLPSVLQILFLYFLARFVAVGSSSWRFLVCRSLYSMYSSVTVKSLSWQSCCPLNPLIPMCVTLFHHTKWRRERGFWKPIAPHLFNIFCLNWLSGIWFVAKTFLLQFFFFPFHG